MSISMRDLARATRLTRDGKLAEATRFIQRSLGFAPAASPAAARRTATPSAGPSAPVAREQGGSAVLDLPFREIPRAPQAPVSRPNHTHVPAEPAGMDAPAVPGLAAEPVAQRPLAKPRPASFKAHSFDFDGARYAYRLYLPSLSGDASLQALPVVVMLHGCKQDAADFARGTDMNTLAEQQKCIVLYPEQLSKANSMRCWNWFEKGHQSRDAGEPAMIAALTRSVLEKHNGDPSRVYVAGLSAGGAMAALVAGLYPELFAAAGVHSGLAAGAAGDVVSAFGAMRRGARGAGDGAAVPTIVFHGSGDKTVHPSNGDQVVASALAAISAQGTQLKKSETGAAPRGAPGAGRPAERTRYSAADGVSHVEHWSVDAGPHAWSGGDPEGSFTDPQGPGASAAMLAFFLQHRQGS
jgi:poly(hydroxyalkanoate) depolymerase family esterase